MQEVKVNKIYAIEDAYVSSDKPDDNENGPPLLNVGRAENGSLNRAMLKFDLNDLNPSSLLSAELCLYQIYHGNRALTTDKFYVHTIIEDWNQDDVTWNTAPSWKREPINEWNDEITLSTEKDTTICLTIEDPKKLPTDGYGFMMRGEEDCDTGDKECDKKDRWFKSSDKDDEYLYWPYLKVQFDPNFSTSKIDSGSFPTALILGVSLGCVTLGLVGALVFMIIRRRRRFEEEEESSVESEVEKDAIDKVGELFGIVSTSEDSQEDTFYTRDTATLNNDEYTTAEGIEVGRNYTIGQRVQNMLFGAPEEETTVTEDYTYDNRGRYRYR